MTDILPYAPVVGFLAATVRLGTPLMIAALGELVAERAGVLNLGVEGMMLVGALSGFMGAYYSGSLLVGWAAAIAAGGLMALLFAFFAITLRCHQVIVALGLNLLAMGATGFIYRTAFGLASSTPQIVPSAPVKFVLLGDLPVLGPVFFQHTPLVYAAIAAAPALWFVLNRTPLGMTIRAVGENARAADTVGIKVQSVRYGATIFGGMLAGLAGAYVSTVSLNVFLEGMIGGAGWIAVAIVIFGNWSPLGIVLAALTFGGAQALQLRAQSAAIDIPREFIVMLPYVLTLVALAGVVRRSDPPAQLCIPYAGRRRG